MKINYFDFGLYRGVELGWMANDILPKQEVGDYSIYGFEACKPYAEALQRTYSYNKKVEIFNVAIAEKEEKVNLYYAANALGHSIFSTKNNVSKENFEEVQGVRFSQWLKDHSVDLENSFNIMKVNIEGAEWHLFRDLVENDLVKHIDVFCGAGHDVEKIGELQDSVSDYYKLLEDNNIKIHRFTEWKPWLNADIPQILFLKMPAKTHEDLKQFETLEDIYEIKHQTKKITPTAENQYSYGDQIGNSKEIYELINSQGSMVDFFQIRSGKKQGDIIRDIFYFKKIQSEDPIWIFEGFGDESYSHREILALIKINNKFKIYENQSGIQTVVVWGQFK